MGKPKTQTVTQKTEIDPILEGYLTSGQLPEDKLASLRRVNEGVYSLAPGTLQPVPDPAAAIAPVAPVAPRTSGMEQRREEQRMQSHIDSVNQRNRDRSIVESGGFGYDPSTGNEMQPGGRDLSMRSGGMYAMGGIVGLPAGGMAPPMMGGGMPNMGNRDMAYQMAMQAMRPQPYAMGGYVEGPGTLDISAHGVGLRAHRLHRHLVSHVAIAHVRHSTTHHRRSHSAGRQSDDAAHGVHAAAAHREVATAGLHLVA